MRRGLCLSPARRRLEKRLAPVALRRARATVSGTRRVREPGEEAPEKASGRGGVPAVLDQDVEHDAVLIHRPPEVVEHAVDPDVDLIEVPRFARPRAPPPEPQ